MNWKTYVSIAIDLIIAATAYWLFGWIGFACFALYEFIYQMIDIRTHLQTIQNTLLSRLPDRCCALCHREILDEGGTIDENRFYHNACADRLAAMEDGAKARAAHVSP